MKDKEYVAYDTETNGVDYNSEVIGFSVCAELDKAYYVIISAWDVGQKKLISVVPKSEAADAVKILLGKKLIMQNAPFDCEKTTYNFGYELMPFVVHDTMIGGHLLNENRSNGLKERGVELYGEDARAEQKAMKDSVHANGGVLTKKQYELFKADPDLLAYYGAKDAILTFKVFFHDAEKLFEQELDKFFYEDESMPLLRGPTYDMNTTGLRVDAEKLQALKRSLEVEILEAQAFIDKEVSAHVKDKYPGTGKTNHFNVSATQQRSWLLYHKLGNSFNTLTKSGRALCKALQLKLPYAPGAKRDFIQACIDNKGRIWEESKLNKKTGKMSRPKKVGDPWIYMQCGKESLNKLAGKYKWVETYLKFAQNTKLLNTYVVGIQTRMQYNIIRPSFLQHGTTSGRYSCKNPNFQNLPRDDKRIKACIISRPGKVFVGADYSQLEPRVFAYFSGDERLLACFKNGDDFYSVIGTEVFNKEGCSLKKNDKNSFAKLHPHLRDVAKVVALSSTYGTTAPKMAPTIGKSIQEAQEVIDDYFDRFPKVYNMMLNAHETAKKTGQVTNLFGRPRRMPMALSINKIYGNTQHSDLPYEVRNILNLAVNHTIQSTGSSIMNRAAIATWKEVRRMEATDARWAEVKIVLQVHDELVLEGPEPLKDAMYAILKRCMEDTTKLPGVDLVAEPKIGFNLAELK